MSTLLSDANNFLTRYPIIRSFFWLLVVVQTTYYLINPILFIFGSSKFAIWTIAGWWWAVIKTIYTLAIQLCIAVPSTAIVYFGIKDFALPLLAKLFLYLTSPRPTARPSNQYPRPQPSFRNTHPESPRYMHPSQSDDDEPPHTHTNDECREYLEEQMRMAFVRAMRERVTEQANLDEEEREWHRRNNSKGKGKGKRKGRKK